MPSPLETERANDRLLKAKLKFLLLAEKNNLSHNMLEAATLRTLRTCASLCKIGITSTEITKILQEQKADEPEVSGFIALDNDFSQRLQHIAQTL